MSTDRRGVPKSLFRAVRRRAFGRSTCFLCGCRLSCKTRSDEHIIPRWAQARFRLWNQRLTLPNGTDIPYRQLTIPCCVSCNRKLSVIEQQVAAATLKGPKAVSALDPMILFLWLGKIFYGLLYRDLFLAWDRAKAKSRPIAEPELVRRFELHHFFLQSVRVPMEFQDGRRPGSVLVMAAQVPEEPELQWDLRDNLDSMYIACRVGPVALFAALQDCGAQVDSPHPLGRGRHFRLHPIQYLEVCALTCYKSTLFNRTPKYILIDGSPIRAVQMPPMGFSAKSVFDEWDMATYARILSLFVDLPLEKVFAPPRAMSWIHGPTGKMRFLDVKKMQWP